MPEHLAQRNEDLYTLKNLDTNVDSTLICNSADVEMTLVSFMREWLKKTLVIWTFMLNEQGESHDSIYIMFLK